MEWSLLSYAFAFYMHRLAAGQKRSSVADVCLLIFLVLRLALCCIFLGARLTVNDICSMLFAWCQTKRKAMQRHL